jgi:OmpA-OmpF porin, OOP family
MKSLVATSLATLTLAMAFPTFAQQSTSGAGSGLRMPYERGFWGHAGLSVGRSNFQGDCALNCDDTDNTFRVFAGGSFNSTIGAEIGLLNLGEFNRGGGNTKAHGTDLALTAGWPIGTSSSVFAKIGAVYTRTDVSGTAVGLRTGKENGWGPRIGVGATIGFAPNWALRADWDRYRAQFVGEKENIDTLTLGVQYIFR